MSDAAQPPSRHLPTVTMAESCSSKSAGDAAKPIADDAEDSVCRFCWRTGKTKNPVPTKHLGDYLVFDSSDKRKCLVCKAFLKAVYKGHPMEDIAKSCQQEQFHDEYMESLCKYEAAFNNTTGRLRNALERAKPPTVITAINEVAAVGKMNMGVFWPRAIYEGTGAKLEKKDMVKYTYMGKALCGIIRDSAHGSPPGTITIEGQDIQKVQKAVRIGNSDESYRKGQLEDIYSRTAAAIASSAVKTTVEKNAETGAEQVKNKVIRKASQELQERPSDSSDDWTRMVKPQLAAFSAQDEDGGDEVDNAKTRPADRKKAKRKQQSSAASSSGAPAAKRKANPPADKLSRPTASQIKVYPSQQQREINVVRVLVSDIGGYLANLKNAEGFETVKADRVSALIEKVEKKMHSPQMVTLLAPNGPGPGQTESLEEQGNALKKQLLGYHKQLVALADVVRSVESTSPEVIESSPAYLKKAVATLVEAGATVTPYLHAKVAKKFCAQALGE